MKDTITLTMKVKGYNEIKKITEENMLSQASSTAFKQTGLYEGTPLRNNTLENHVHVVPVASGMEEELAVEVETG